jgi:hypothetical protein
VHIPAWVPFVLAVVVAVGLCVIVGYLVRASAADRRARAKAVVPPDPAQVKASLGEAIREIDAGASPREVVIRLYASLLLRVGMMVGGVEWNTPEEIRVQHLERLGIRPDAAEALTRLFEEARYSTHPMGTELAGRARQAILAARADLDRAPVPAA